MNPVWSPEAIADLAALRACIAKDSPAAAQRVALRVMESVEMLLSENPDVGRPGRVPGTRELVISRTPFIVRTACRENTSKSCASITAHAAGPSDFDKLLVGSRISALR